MSMSEAIIKQLKRIMFIVDRFSLVSIEPYENQCLAKHTRFAISLSISKHIFVDIALYWISSFAYFNGQIKNLSPSISND